MNNRFKFLAKGRIAKRGERNKTEAEYEALLEADPRVVKHWFEPMSIRLSHPDGGQGARYTPDFMILMDDGTVYIDDVKGSGLDDNAAVVRIKCAAELWDHFIFRIAKKRRVRDGGGFDIKEV